MSFFGSYYDTELNDAFEREHFIKQNVENRRR